MNKWSKDSKEGIKMSEMKGKMSEASSRKLALVSPL